MSTNQPTNQKVSTIETNRKKKEKSKGKVKVGPNTGFEIHYFTKKEYNNLDHGKRKELSELCHDKESSTPDHNVYALYAQVAELEKQLIATIGTKNSDEKAERRNRQNCLSIIP